jgi:hypothetical protein
VGTLPDGASFVNIPVSDKVMDPGEIVSGVLLKFNNPQRVAFTFKHNVLGVMPATNHPPVAKAGSDQSAFVGDEVTFDGSGSSDEDGNPLTYHWRIVSQPASSAAQLENPDTIAAKLVINRKGSYQIELIVNDDQADSQSAFVAACPGILTVMRSPSIGSYLPNLN